MQHSQKQLSHNTENFVKQAERCHSLKRCRHARRAQQKAKHSCDQGLQARSLPTGVTSYVRMLIGINIKTYGQRAGVCTPVRR